MIEYVGVLGPPEALNYPISVCDTCREQGVERGNVIWGTTAGAPGLRRGTPIHVAHKGRCDAALDLWFAQVYFDADGWMQLSEELDVFARQLARNATKPLSAGDGIRTYPLQLALPRLAQETR
ncbi:hypothetical protein ACIP29_26165 [Streptomyces coelicoflavus]|uniref:hypothetical protein n=1 Tax=Streptomyces coelicoflavus TaxID=285562 RepID=UPI00382D4103